jgi:hypothetical protein
MGKTVKRMLKMIKNTVCSFKFWLFLIALSIPLSIPFGFLYLLNHGNPIMNYWIEHEVKNHLEHMGYKKEEIAEQYVAIPKDVINKDYYQTHYVVVFKDEPNITYYYGKKKPNGEIVQFCEKDKIVEGVSEEITSNKTKHSENSCVSIYANRD